MLFCSHVGFDGVGCWLIRCSGSFSMMWFSHCPRFAGVADLALEGFTWMHFVGLFFRFAHSSLNTLWYFMGRRTQNVSKYFNNVILIID